MKVKNTVGLISVVIPAYNAENTVEEAIESVCMQTYQDIEIIVVDDGSTDMTSQLIDTCAAKDMRIRPIHSEQNRGVSVSRKVGVEASYGDWIAFLDSDDHWAPDKLSRQVMMQTETSADLLYTGVHFEKWDGEPIGYVMQVPKEVRYEKLLKQNIISNSSVMIRKSLYQENCVMRDDLHEDYACWLRVLRSGNKACGVNDPLITYRISGQSKSGNKIKSAKMCWRTYRAVGLGLFETSYYMMWYTITGLLKYKNLR